MTHGASEGKTGIDLRWALVGVLYLAFLVTVDASAYLRLIPAAVNSIPWYDTVGHFLFLGLAGYVLHRALRRRRWGRVPLAIVIMCGLAALEEGLQGFSSARTLSLSDYAADVAGIATFWAVDTLAIRARPL